MQWALFYILVLTSTFSNLEAVEPNFEDIDETKEEPQNEVVNIEQENPHSNAVHIAHNIPTGSDITVNQKAPYNSTVHISLNIAKECKVKVSKHFKRICCSGEKHVVISFSVEIFSFREITDNAQINKSFLLCHENL